jgi:hypothetical protein
MCDFPVQQFVQETPQHSPSAVQLFAGDSHVGRDEITGAASQAATSANKV